MLEEKQECCFYVTTVYVYVVVLYITPLHTGTVVKNLSIIANA